jgi:hypothetical protein
VGVLKCPSATKYLEPRALGWAPQSLTIEIKFSMIGMETPCMGGAQKVREPEALAVWEVAGPETSKPKKLRLTM